MLNDYKIRKKFAKVIGRKGGIKLRVEGHAVMEERSEEKKNRWRGKNRLINISCSVFLQFKANHRSNSSIT